MEVDPRFPRSGVILDAREEVRGSEENDMVAVLFDAVGTVDGGDGRRAASRRRAFMAEIMGS